MKTTRFMGVVVLGLAIFLLVALPPAMSKYDSATKDRVLSMVARELPPNATMAEVDVFMRRHTVRYAFDDQRVFEYSGYLPQTGLDRILADREVELILKVNRGSKTFKSAEVIIYYTGP